MGDSSRSDLRARPSVSSGSGIPRNRKAQHNGHSSLGVRGQLELAVMHLRDARHYGETESVTGTAT